MQTTIFGTKFAITHLKTFMKNITISLLALFAITLTLQSCSQRRVTRINPNEMTDLSGRWNDADNKLVANAIINDMMQKPWLKEYNEKFSKKPVIIVGQIRNKTSEFIDPVAIVKEIERACLTTGNIRVVSSAEERKEVRSEREDQQIFASEESRKKWGKEIGEDFMLNGVIYSVTDEFRNEKIVAYQSDFELTDLETNEKVWMGQSRIKKQIRN